jgi:ATP-dependent 26S proteasome regulatory subunit
MTIQSLANRSVRLRFHLSKDEPQYEHLLRLINLLPDVQWHNQWAEIHMPLHDAAIYRDIVLDLWEQLHKRPGTTLSLDEEQVTINDIKQAITVLECAQAHERSVMPERHCHPQQGWDWGCLYLGHVNPHLHKGELHTILNQEIQHRWLHLCPFFDHSKIELLTGIAPIYHNKIIEIQGPSMNHTTKGYQANILPTHYNDIGGLDHVIAMVREIIEIPILHPEIIQRLGITPSKGILLYGPPGCGKTLLARAVAYETGAHFIAISGPELVSKWHGESEDKLRKIFAEAQENQPSIVFFDEIDAIAQSRSSAESLRLDARFTTQLLVLLDGIHDLGQVFVLATTNRPDLLDPALLRPGRLDRIIEIPLPDLAGRLAILTLHVRRVPLAPDVSLESLARALDGATGADIACVIREAAYASLRRTLGSAALRREPLTDAELSSLVLSKEDFQAALQVLRNRGFHLAENVTGTT